MHISIQTGRSDGSSTSGRPILGPDRICRRWGLPCPAVRREMRSVGGRDGRNQEKAQGATETPCGKVVARVKGLSTRGRAEDRWSPARSPEGVGGGGGEGISLRRIGGRQLTGFRRRGTPA